MPLTITVAAMGAACHGGHRAGLPFARGQRRLVKDVIAVAASRRPYRGGHLWVVLQYLLGWQRLGHDVLYLDRLPSEPSSDDAGRPVPPESSPKARYLGDVLRHVGLGDSWALLSDDGHSTVGLPRPAVLERLRRAPLLLNVMGFLDDEELLALPARRVFLDIDPGFGQMWRELGLADLFQGHDRYVTIGANVGRPGCAVPDNGIDWLTTSPPVVLEHWPVTPLPPAVRFTSVGSWRGPTGPVEYGGAVYGLRAHEFRRFFDLPRDTGAMFELALDIDEAEAPDLAALDAAGWRRIDPRAVAGTPASYRTWIQESSAELMVAKSMYVATRGGWFSDRSVCYLASGRPVLAQDTGLGDLYPVGEGLLTFSSYAEAVEGVQEISGDLPRHAAAARRVAEECFDSDRVLTSLLDRVT
jgi:hypothetical protein